MKSSFALSNLLLLSGGASFAASFAFQHSGHHGINVLKSKELSLQQRASVNLGARKKAAASDDEEEEETGKPQMDPAKRAALQGVLTQIERNYGRGSVVRLGDASHMVVDSTPTGSLTLDAALGGGYPKGRVVEIYGPESSGKTTLALHAIAECQKKGGTAAFVDAEHALDPVYGEYKDARCAFLQLCIELFRNQNFFL